MKDRIEELYHANRDLAISEVKKMALGILNSQKKLDEFVMAMGSYFFTSKKDKSIINTFDEKMNASYNYYQVDAQPYFKELNDFIMKWDDVFKITGEPMRFTKNGIITTDW